jgi:hypothetical protein
MQDIRDALDPISLAPPANIPWLFLAGVYCESIR